MQNRGAGKSYPTNAGLRPSEFFSIDEPRERPSRHPMPYPRLILAPALACALLAPLASFAASAENVVVTRLEDRIRIEVGGSLFTEYRHGDATKPYFYPVLLGDGTPLTRDWPMKEDTAGEEKDHPHHRGLWFSHGKVNGHDFWLDNARGSLIVQDKVVETTSGATGVLRTTSKWQLRDGTVICRDERTVRVRAVPGGRVMDFEVTLVASEGPLVLGDTKEGSMSIRLNEAMRLTRRGPDRKPVAGAGTIINSEGVKNGDTWGKRAKWVDYYAPLEKGVVGVAIFDHPENPRFPTWWHVRDYGLFAANPFGQHDFERLPDASAGDLKVPAGGKVTFRYQFYFHQGDTAAADVAGRFESFAKTK